SRRRRREACRGGRPERSVLHMTTTPSEIHEEVRRHYAQAATGASCCDAEGCCSTSLGCGNPTALADLLEGETVLDLGSGGGLDVIASARRVGKTGRAYGLDMTDEMIELARRNAREVGVDNAIFLKGLIEAIPLSDGSVDVVISNCVVNLSPD